MTTTVEIDGKQVSLLNLQKMPFSDIWNVIPDYFKDLAAKVAKDNNDVVVEYLNCLFKRNFAFVEAYSDLLLKYFNKVVYDGELTYSGGHSAHIFIEFDEILKNKKKNKQYINHNSLGQYLQSMFSVIHASDIVSKLQENGESVEEISSKLLLISLFTGLSVKMDDMGFCHKCGQSHGRGALFISEGNLVFTMGYKEPCFQEKIVEHEILIEDGALLCSDWFRDNNNELAEKSNVWEERTSGGRWSRISSKKEFEFRNEYQKEGFFSHPSTHFNQLFTNGEKFVIISNFYDEVEMPDGWKCVGSFDCSLRRVLITSKKNLEKHVSKEAMKEIMKDKSNMISIKVPKGKYKFTSDATGFYTFTKDAVPSWIPVEFSSHLVTYFEKV